MSTHGTETKRVSYHCSFRLFVGFGFSFADYKCGLSLYSNDSALSRASSIASIGTQFTSICDQLADTLVVKQVQFCKKHPSFMLSVQSGASRAIDECKFQFRTRRWNCSTLDESRQLPTIVPLPPATPLKKMSKKKPGIHRHTHVIYFYLLFPCYVILFLRDLIKTLFK